MILKLSDLLDGALRGAGLEATSIIWRIAENWADIVGPRVAARAAPIRLRRDELTLSAPDAVWRQELTLLGPEIAAKINQNIGKNVVRRIRLVSGPMASPDTTGRRRRLRSRGSGTPPTEALPAPPRPSGSPTAEGPEGIAAALEALAATRSTRLADDRAARALERGRRRPRR